MTDGKGTFGNKGELCPTVSGEIDIGTGKWIVVKIRLNDVLCVPGLLDSEGRVRKLWQEEEPHHYQEWSPET